MSGRIRSALRDVTNSNVTAPRASNKLQPQHGSVVKLKERPVDKEKMKNLSRVGSHVSGENNPKPRGIGVGAPGGAEHRPIIDAPSPRGPGEAIENHFDEEPNPKRVRWDENLGDVSFEEFDAGLQHESALEDVQKHPKEESSAINSVDVGGSQDTEGAVETNDSEMVHGPDMNQDCLPVSSAGLKQPSTSAVNGQESKQKSGNQTNTNCGSDHQSTCDKQTRALPPAHRESIDVNAILRQTLAALAAGDDTMIDYSMGNLNISFKAPVPATSSTSSANNDNHHRSIGSDDDKGFSSPSVSSEDVALVLGMPIEGVDTSHLAWHGGTNSNTGNVLRLSANGRRSFANNQGVLRQSAGGRGRNSNSGLNNNPLNDSLIRNAPAIRESILRHIRLSNESGISNPISEEDADISTVPGDQAVSMPVSDNRLNHFSNNQTLSSRGPAAVRSPSIPFSANNNRIVPGSNNGSNGHIGITRPGDYFVVPDVATMQSSAPTASIPPSVDTILGRQLVDQGFRRVYLTSARALCRHVPVWTHQRPYSDDRVQAIADAKDCPLNPPQLVTSTNGTPLSHSGIQDPQQTHEYYIYEGTPAFIGPILVYVLADGVRVDLGIFDGQHRAKAMQEILRRREERLIERVSPRLPTPQEMASLDFQVTVEVWPVTSYVDVANLYREVNKAEPVQEIDLHLPFLGALGRAGMNAMGMGLGMGVGMSVGMAGRKGGMDGSNSGQNEGEEKGLIDAQRCKEIINEATTSLYIRYVPLLSSYISPFFHGHFCRKTIHLPLLLPLPFSS